MRSDSTFSKWFRSTKSSVKCLFKGNIKFFPQEYPITDPLFASIERCRREGQGSLLILFHLESYNHLIGPLPAEMVGQVEEAIKAAVIGNAFKVFKERDVLGARQLHGENYCLLVRERTDAGFEEIHKRAVDLGKAVEKQLQLMTDPPMDGRITFGVGCHFVDPLIPHIRTAVYTAFHYAHEIATKKLPPYFNPSRKRLQSIIQEEDITVLAQPIVSLKDGDIWGWEILTRGPQNTPFHSPTELFEFAYQADLLSKMEFLVMKKAWSEIAKRQIRQQVFINVTAITLCHPLFLNHLLELIREYPFITASQIIFEITERHAIKDYEYMGRMMGKFRCYGFRFAVDDAGSGYSSLQSISELIPDIIKIDKSVIQQIDRHSVKRSMLKALLLFAKDMQCDVVAEGVEREEEAEVLFQHEVQMGQGYYFSKPEPLVYEFAAAQIESMKEKVRNHRQNVASA